MDGWMKMGLSCSLDSLGDMYFDNVERERVGGGGWWMVGYEDGETRWREGSYKIWKKKGGGEAETGIGD